MSRGIKDLRELICVSRLTVHNSDEEFPPSDDEVLLGRLSRLSFGIDTQSLSDAEDSRQSSAGSTREFTSYTPDSGIATNGNSREENDPITPPMEAEASFVPMAPVPPSGDVMPSKSRSKRRRKKKSQSEVMGPLHELPKTAPLPPVRSNSMGSSRASSSSSDGISARAEVIAPISKRKDYASNTSQQEGNFDDILTYLDATQVSEFLLLANSHVADLATWCYTGENFVHFAHFWLSDFPDMQKQEIIHLEYSILLDQLQFAFASGRDSGKVKQRDIQRFLGAVFREYPSRLLSSKGAFLFLDYLDILSSERTEQYKKVLSNVKCSTRIKQHAQWTLAIRSFTLVSVWIAIVNFYRKLTINTSKSLSDSSVSLSSIGTSNPNQKRMYQAIR